MLSDRVRTVVYAGDSFVTGDDIAEALLRYAAALAGVSQAATVEVPVLRADGTIEYDTLLIGPASQILAHPGPADVDEIEDVRVVTDLNNRIAALTSSRGLPLDEHPVSWGDGE
jgi:hypothetical protein